MSQVIYNFFRDGSKKIKEQKTQQGKFWLYIKVRFFGCDIVRYCTRFPIDYLSLEIFMTVMKNSLIPLDWLRFEHYVS